MNTNNSEQFIQWLDCIEVVRLFHIAILHSFILFYGRFIVIIYRPTEKVYIVTN